MIRLRLFVLAATLVALTACGFHLRSKIALPPDLGPVLVVSSTPYSPLAESVAQGIRTSGAELAPEGATDVATLRILSERWGSRPIAIDQYGRAQEYSLRFAAIFVLTRADGTVLVPQQVIELSRDYVSSPNNVTGTATEREVLADELRREMSASILRRVDGVIRSGQSLPALPTEPAPAEPAAPVQPVLDTQSGH